MADLLEAKVTQNYEWLNKNFQVDLIKAACKFKDHQIPNLCNFALEWYISEPIPELLNDVK
jgi:hypothetical protein